MAYKLALALALALTLINFQDNTKPTNYNHTWATWTI
jgi:hypothetical protein